MQKEPTFIPKNFIDRNGDTLYPAYYDVPIEMLGITDLYDYSYQVWEFAIMFEGQNNTLREEKKQLLIALIVVSVILFLGLVWFLTNFWEILPCVS